MAERKNRLIMEATGVMLEEKSMPKFYWAEAVQTAVYIQNWIRDKMSAHKLYFGQNLNLRHLRVFGSIAYVHVPHEKQTKLNPKSENCILVGYSHEQKGYKCYNPQIKTVQVRRDVEFHELASWYSLLTSTSDSNPIPEDEAKEPETIRAEDEDGFGTVDECLISFRLTRSN